ncbi:hypothetical protein [Elusimicrobium simillimum]|uniref:hypothetical protein n=1 Tax=Elusimicrobium simillimum TaxID=3143438 RepID=UPI003C6FE1E7
MKNLKLLLISITITLSVSGCASVRALPNTALCDYARFDLQDSGVAALNRDNLFNICVLSEYCYGESGLLGEVCRKK